MPKTLTVDDAEIPTLRAALLQPRYMTPEQIADLIARARANTKPFRIAVGRKLHGRSRERSASGCSAK